ncbi:hypothetical protein BJV78DRAFT_1220711 [Lactifluus subvellereus]|nr:hypothetical protein BJV78DRAFT_1220711 [Lactifluus subvellereus]
MKASDPCRRGGEAFPSQSRFGFPCPSHASVFSDEYCRRGTSTSNSSAYFPVPVPFAIRYTLFNAQRGLSSAQGFNPPAHQSNVGVREWAEVQP